MLLKDSRHRDVPPRITSVSSLKSLAYASITCSHFGNKAGPSPGTNGCGRTDFKSRHRVDSLLSSIPDRLNNGWRRDPANPLLPDGLSSDQPLDKLTRLGYSSG